MAASAGVGGAIANPRHGRRSGVWAGGIGLGGDSAGAFGQGESLASRPTPPAAKHVARAEGRPAAARAADSPEPAALVAARGQRRLAADIPPYLLEPWVVNAPLAGWYFSRAELTVPPVLQDAPRLQFPDGERCAAGRGRVLLRVFLGVGGAVEGIEVLSSDPPSVFDEAAVAAFANLRFRPGEIEGVAVTSQTASRSISMTVKAAAVPTVKPATAPRPSGRRIARGAARAAAHRFVSARLPGHERGTGAY
ncbi:MAG: TonB family protein [Candidatus Accumulibacter necessarius]|uniref:TonB family protein n=1 Tax=Candidatus Accumulibacter necessarius TaxID=2954386 RepID=UPI002FC28695